jgi:hypothetical protein
MFLNKRTRNKQLKRNGVEATVAVYNVVFFFFILLHLIAFVNQVFEGAGHVCHDTGRRED